jgi:SAM-dependent methyltransferase
MKYGARDTTQFSWYETSLPAGERKQRGHFSTPHALVDQILDACGYTSSADLRDLRVLDPACGSGNFLARAASRFCQAGQAMGLNQEQTSTLAQRNIWGLDPDPVACLLAEMQVRAAIETTCGTCSDSLSPHIHQADSLALFWEPCVDLLVTNPPYLAAKNIDLSHYPQARQRGQMDSYLLFLDLALRAVRPGGWIGLVLPDPVLARANAAPERARLLRECTLHHIWHLSGVFAAEVGAAVLIAQQIPPRPLHRVCWTRARWRDEQRLYRSDQPAQRVGQILLARQPGAELRYLLSHEQGRLIERLRRAQDEHKEQAPGTRGLIPLEELVSIKRGEEIGRENALLGPLADPRESYPVLRGGVDIAPYRRPEAGWGIARVAVKKPLERYLAPKLLVVKSTERLQAALDTRGHVVLQTLYLLQLHKPENESPGSGSPLTGARVSPIFSFHGWSGEDDRMDTYYFLLALLNSRLLGAYVYYLHTAYKLVQPQIEQTVLARLPIAWSQPEIRQEIAERARALEQACSRAGSVVEWEEQFSFLFEEQERAIRALYAAALPGIFTDKGVTIYG